MDLRGKIQFEDHFSGNLGQGSTIGFKTPRPVTRRTPLKIQTETPTGTKQPVLTTTYSQNTQSEIGVLGSSGQYKASPSAVVNQLLQNIDLDDTLPENIRREESELSYINPETGKN